MFRSLLIASGICMLASVNLFAAAKEDVKSHTGTVVSAASGKLVMTDNTGKEHSHTVPAAAKIMVDGKEGKLEDLKKGDQVTVTTDSSGNVTAISRAASVKPASAPKTPKAA